MAVEAITSARIHEHAREWEHTAVRTELLVGTGAAVLSILGIVGVFPSYLAAIAVIGLGAILLLQGGNVVLHYCDLFSQSAATSTVSASAVSRGITAGFLAGIAGIFLGILALLRIAPITLLSVAVITYGGAMMLTSGEPVWMNSFLAKDNVIMHQLMHCVSLAAAGGQILAGLAALVLGILALVGIASLMMVLIALLAIGTSIILRSAALEGFLGDIL
jgi:hypothetical protein